MAVLDAVKASRRITVERWMGVAYIFSVALSPLGPVIHYSLWGLCLLLLIWNVLVNDASLFLSGLGTRGRTALWLLWMALFWSMGAALFSYTNLHAWGKNVTVLFEVWWGCYLAARTLSSDESRSRFLTVFVTASAVIAALNLLRFAGSFPWIPNHVLEHGNSLGCLALLLLPPMVGYALWALEEKWLLQAVVIMPTCLLLIFSCSSGAWLSGALGLLVLIGYALRAKKLKWRTCLIGVLILLLALPVGNRLSSGKIEHKIMREVRQITAVHDVRKLTSNRNEVWTAAWHILKLSPIKGWGGALFYDMYKALLDFEGERLGLTRRYLNDHPHSTYLYLAYIGGLPALVLFLTAIILLLVKSVKLAARERDALFPWGVVCVALLVEILTYGTNGDVLQGRRDISVLVWCFLGVLVALPELLPERKEQAKN